MPLVQCLAVQVEDVVVDNWTYVGPEFIESNPID
jgi:hypothetical protein